MPFSVPCLLLPRIEYPTAVSLAPSIIWLKLTRAAELVAGDQVGAIFYDMSKPFQAVIFC